MTDEEFKKYYYELVEFSKTWDKNVSKINEILKKEGMFKNINSNDIVDCLWKINASIDDFKAYTNGNSFNRNANNKYIYEKLVEIYKRYSNAFAELRKFKEYNLFANLLEINV